jgi:hypothetical protein
MSRQGSFRYTVRARCGAAEAVGLLSDLSRQVDLHPLIARVERRPAGDGVVDSFAVTDRLRWGPLNVPVRYRADVLRATRHDVATVARTFPGTTVHNHTRVTSDPEGVQLDVEVTLAAPSLLFPYAFRRAFSAHHTLARLLRDALDRPQHRLRRHRG